MPILRKQWGTNECKKKRAERKREGWREGKRKRMGLRRVRMYICVWGRSEEGDITHFVLGSKRSSVICIWCFLPGNKKRKRWKENESIMPGLWHAAWLRCSFFPWLNTDGTTFKPTSQHLLCPFQSIALSPQHEIFLNNTSFITPCLQTLPCLWSDWTTSAWMPHTMWEYVIKKETEPQPCPGMFTVWCRLSNYNAVRRARAGEWAEMLGEQREGRGGVETWFKEKHDTWLASQKN